jgi:hypothetical protein
MPEYKSLKVTLDNDPKGKDIGTFSMHTFMLTDAFALQNEAGLTVTEMVAGLDKKDPKCVRAIVWFLKWKRGDGQHITEINFPMADFSWEVVGNPTKARTSRSANAT